MFLFSQEIGAMEESSERIEDPVEVLKSVENWISRVIESHGGYEKFNETIQMNQTVDKV